MPEYHVLLLFLFASAALVATPGPDMLLVTSRSVAQGPMSGLATYLGIATGSYLHAIALALGLSQLFLTLPLAYDAVRFVGALYLLFLAWQAFTSKAGSNDQSKTHKPSSVWVMFRQGLLTNVLNPKVALFFLALFPQFLDPDQGSIALQIMVLATILNLSGLALYSVLILVITRTGRAAARNPKIQLIAQRLTGVIFVGLAARLAFDNSR